MLNLCAVFVFYVLLQNVYFDQKMTKVVMLCSLQWPSAREEMVARASLPFSPLPFRGAAA